MAETSPPVVGEWYQGAEGKFRVVALDETNNTIEVQYYDASLEEFDAEAWDDLGLVSIAPPEDWSGPFDDIEPFDMDDTAAAMRPHDWGSPLDEV